MWIRMHTGDLVEATGVILRVDDRILLAPLASMTGGTDKAGVQLAQTPEAAALLDAIAEWLDKNGHGCSVPTDETVSNPVFGDRDIVYMALPNKVFDIPKWLEEHQKGEGK